MNKYTLRKYVRGNSNLQMHRRSYNDAHNIGREFAYNNLHKAKI